MRVWWRTPKVSNAIRTCSNWTTKYINKNRQHQNVWTHKMDRKNVNERLKRILLPLCLSMCLCIYIMKLCVCQRREREHVNGWGWGCDGTVASILKKMLGPHTQRVTHWLDEWKNGRMNEWMNRSNTQFSMRQIYKHRFDSIRYGSI